MSPKIPPLWGLTPPLHGESIDPVMGVSYNKNMCLMLDADLTLLLDAELIGFSGSCLSGNAKLTGFEFRLLEVRIYGFTHLLVY